MTAPPPTQHQARLMWLALTGLAWAVLVALVVALVWGLGRVVRLLSPVLWPLAVAGALAYLLDPLVDFLQRKGATRLRAIITVFAGALLLAGLLLASIVPLVLNEAGQLASQVPVYADRASRSLEGWVNHPPAWARSLFGAPSAPPPSSPGGGPTNQPPSLQAAEPPAAPGPLNVPAGAGTNAPGLFGGALAQQELQTATTLLAKGLRDAGPWLLKQAGRFAFSWFGVIVGLALVPIYTFYFLLEKRRISSSWTEYLPVTRSRFREELVFMLQSTNNYLIAFFRGQVLVAICDGTLYGLGFLAIGLPYPALLGAMAIVLTIVPFLGAVVTCCTALVIAVAQCGDWLHPALVLALVAVVQTTEVLFISPRIMGGRVGLHPVTIIIAVMAGTTLLGGLLGGVLAIPLTAALRVAMFRYVWKKRPPAE